MNPGSWSISLRELLHRMADHGSSVVLTWGEDTDQWECSWITRGQRFTAVRGDPLSAIVEVLDKAGWDRTATGETR
jgi:hypothetical protein